MKPEIIDDESSIKWTDVSTQPRFVIGEAVSESDDVHSSLQYYPDGHITIKLRMHTFHTPHFICQADPLVDKGTFLMSPSNHFTKQLLSSY